MIYSSGRWKFGPQFNSLFVFLACLSSNEIKTKFSDALIKRNRGRALRHARKTLLHVLYSLEIGRFLELDFLSQSCEDVIVDNLSLDNLSQVFKCSCLRWVVGIAARVAMGPPSSAAPLPLRVQCHRTGSGVARTGQEPPSTKFRRREPQVVVGPG